MMKNDTHGPRPAGGGDQAGFLGMTGKSIHIPIKVAPVRYHRLHVSRRVSQAIFLALLVLIPVTGLFRIDPLVGAFVVLDRQVWFSDFFLVFGLWMVLSSLLVLLYSVVGTAFCGWACPQNTVSEWANFLTRAMLGRKAKVALNGEAVQVARRKNKWSNWFALGLSLALTSMLLALVPMFYFYPPAQMFNFVLLKPDPAISGSWYWIYTVFVLILLLNTAFIRHFWCRFMCIYKVWQHTFKTRQTLALSYDSSRARNCEKCDYCLQACFLELDPRETQVYDSCVNCGACIVACDKRHKKHGGRGLLGFVFGNPTGVQKSRWLQGRLTHMFARVQWTFPLFALGAVFFIWGLISYSPVHASVFRADEVDGRISQYKIQVANKRYRAANVSLQVQGLQPRYYHLEKSRLSFAGAGRESIILTIKDGLKPGSIYRIRILVTDTLDNTLVLEANHFVARNHHG